MVKCIKANIKDAETIRKKIINSEIYDYNYKVLREGNFLYIPVIEKYGNLKVYNKKLISNKKKLNFKDLIINKFGNEINTSYDLIGNIAILEIDDSNNKEIGKILLNSNDKIDVVVKKIGAHEGKFRIQKYEVIASRNKIKNLETLHNESGVKIKLDINKVYFTPRLANERMRIAKNVKDNEIVLVMFSGVGVYPTIISKYSKAKEIYGIEINPDAHKYAEENLKLNKINNVKLFSGDVNEVIQNFKIKFDRIIMPLPKESFDFLELALKFIKKNGIIHIYFFSEEDNVNYIVNKLMKNKKFKFLHLIKAGQNKPNSYRYCLDFMIE